MPGNWKCEDLARHSCVDGSHSYVGYDEVFGRAKAAEAEGLLTLGLVEWLRYPRVLRIERTVGIRGLSCRIGEWLTIKIAEGHEWAHVMRQEMHV